MLQPLKPILYFICIDILTVSTKFFWLIIKSISVMFIKAFILTFLSNATKENSFKIHFRLLKIYIEFSSAFVLKINNQTE